MRRSTSCIASLAFTFAASTASIAYAMPNFPEEIQTHLELAGPPPCNLCHDSTIGGGPVSQPFGRAMLAAGLNPSVGSSLTEALDQLDAEKTDSNADGIPDIDGVRSGILPLASKPPVEYGCALRSSAGYRQSLGLFAYVAFSSLLWLRRSRAEGVRKAGSYTTQRRNGP